MTVVDDPPAGGIPAAPEGLGLSDQGDWLVEQRRRMDCGEYVWLRELAQFDRSQGWVLDGQLSGVDWLVLMAGMARGTAYEKLQVAHELTRRPVVAGALATGRISYSAARAICRIEHPDAEVDESLVVLAEAGTVGDVERAVRHYRLHADQHRPPVDPQQRRGLRVHRSGEGMTTIEVTLPDLEAEEVLAAIRAALPPVEAGVGPGPAEADRPVDDSARAESGVPLVDDRSYPQMRADALVELVRVGATHLDRPPGPADDRYMVHVVHRCGEGTTLIDGSPLPPAAGARVCCDSSRVDHVVAAGGEPLVLGRRTRVWSAAQRRAILVRDRATCRFPGCDRRVADIHHITWWEHGGPTDVANGLLLCPRHHTLVHDGFLVEGDANRQVRFSRPGGRPIGCS